MSCPTDLFKLFAEYFPRRRPTALPNFNVKQDTSESIDVFRTRVEIFLQENGFRSLDQDELNDLEIATFLNGLDPFITERIGGTEFRDLREAANAAIRIESRFGHHHTTRSATSSSYKRPSDDNKRTYERDKRPRYDSPYQNGLSAITSARRQVNYETGTRQSTPANFVCFFCGKMGHRYQDCDDANGHDKRAVSREYKEILEQVKNKTFVNYKTFVERMRPSTSTSNQVALNSSVVTNRPQ